MPFPTDCIAEHVDRLSSPLHFGLGDREQLSETAVTASARRVGFKDRRRVEFQSTRDDAEVAQGNIGGDFCVGGFDIQIPVVVDVQFGRNGVWVEADALAGFADRSRRRELCTHVMLVKWLTLIRWR